MALPEMNSLPQNWNTLQGVTGLYSLDFETIMQSATDPTTGEVDMTKVQQMLDDQQADFKQKSQLADQMNDGLKEISDAEEMAGSLTRMGPAMASSNVFNLKKTSQFDGLSDPGMFPANLGPDESQMEQDLINSDDLNDQIQPEENTDYPFPTHADLRDELDSVQNEYEQVKSSGQDAPPPQVTAADMLAQYAGDKRDSVNSLLKQYYSPIDATEEDKLDIANQIHSLIWGEGGDQGGMEIMAPYRESSEMFKNQLDKATQDIKQLAEKYVTQRKKASISFNMQKFAQHQTVDNAIVWGPSQVRPDPFLRGQPVSDWHIVERNKGFGQDIDGVWNIDWEAVWRGNIMDKYSRPYRDPKTGEYVGGYIQKRFEVDKWIPETNNYQLLPGEKRKPRLPQYGLLESRLQHMRSKDERGYGPETDTSKPFNWREAKSNKINKNARSNRAPWMDDGDTEADALVNQALSAFDDLSPGDQDQINQEINEPYEARDENLNLSNNELAEMLIGQGYTPRDVSNPEISQEMEYILRGSEMTATMTGRAAASKNNSKKAQTDVATEKQLENVKHKSGIQRHQSEEYVDNYGDEIEDQKKKVTPKGQ